MSTVTLQTFTEPGTGVLLEIDGVGASTHPAVESFETELLPTVKSAARERRTFIPPGRSQRVSLLSLEPIQEWEGVVDWVDGDAFGARLYDLTDPGEVEFTEFDLVEVSDDDLKLVLPGAVFYWTIAREINATRRIRHVIMLRFRRLPIVRAARRPEIQREAKWIADRLQLGEPPTGAHEAGP